MLLAEAQTETLVGHRETEPSSFGGGDSRFSGTQTCRTKANQQSVATPSRDVGF